MRSWKRLFKEWSLEGSGRSRKKSCNHLLLFDSVQVREIVHRILERGKFMDGWESPLPIIFPWIISSTFFNPKFHLKSLLKYLRHSTRRLLDLISSFLSKWKTVASCRKEKQKGGYRICCYAKSSPNNSRQAKSLPAKFRPETKGGYLPQVPVAHVFKK